MHTLHSLGGVIRARNMLKMFSEILPRVHRMNNRHPFCCGPTAIFLMKVMTARSHFYRRLQSLLRQLNASVLMRAENRGISINFKYIAMPIAPLSNNELRGTHQRIMINSWRGCGTGRINLLSLTLYSPDCARREKTPLLCNRQRRVDLD